MVTSLGLDNFNSTKVQFGEAVDHRLQSLDLIFQFH